MKRLIAMLTLFPLIGLAQENLDPVTVSASLSPQKASTTGREITVIRGEEFSKLPVHSLDELLKYLPGVEVQSRGPMGSQSDITLRGGTFQQVLVILDGLRINDPNTGHFDGYIPIAPSEIDRIEILYGGTSAIYGSEAVGGVITIVTKSFAAKQSKNLEAMGTVGQYGLLNANLGLNYSDQKNHLSAGILSNNANGQPLRGTRGYFHNNTVSASYSHIFDPFWQLSLRTSYDHRNFSAQNFYTTYTSDTASEKVGSWWNQARLSYKKEKDQINFDAGYKRTLDQYSFNSAFAPNQNVSKLLQLVGTYQHRFTERMSLTTGAQYLGQSVVSNDRGNHTLNETAFFVILNEKLSRNFLATPSLRWDDGQWVPQLNLSYKFQKLQIRASGGRTIRRADFTELYNNYHQSFVAGGSIGNPNLLPEHSWSYEAGADYFATAHLKLSATVFRRNEENVIDWVPTNYNAMPRKVNLSPAGAYALASNIPKLNTTGADASLQYEVQHFFATAGLTWLHDHSSEDVPSFYISSHAKFLINFNFRYENDWGSISVNGLYKDRNPQVASAIIAPVASHYFVLNAMLTGWIIRKKLNTFIEADNLFNKSYADLLGAQMPGRWITGGVRLMIP